MYLNKRNFILAASLILSAGAAFPQAAATDKPAEKDQHAHHRRAGHGMGRLSEALNLTDAQKQQAKTIHEKYRASTGDVRAQMKTLHDQFKAAKEANNTAEIERLKEQRKALFTKARESWTAERAELRSILTPEQQTKLDQM